MSKKHGNWKKQPSYSQEKLKEAREVYRLQQEAADNPEVVVNIADIADETLDESSLTPADKPGSTDASPDESSADDVLNLPGSTDAVEIQVDFNGFSALPPLDASMLPNITPAADNSEVVVNVADIADETLDESSLTLEDKLGSVGEDDVLNLPAASENYLTPADNWLNLPDTTINPLKLPLADDLGDDLI